MKTDTEVPRRTLVSALKSETKLFSTDDLKDKFFKDTEVDFAKALRIPSSVQRRRQKQIAAGATP